MALLVLRIKLIVVLLLFGSILPLSAVTVKVVNEDDSSDYFQAEDLPSKVKSEFCGLKGQWSKCNRGQATCRTYGEALKAISNSSLCTPGCVCMHPHEYVLDERIGQCVHLTKCLKSPNPCGPSGSWSRRTPRRQETCATFGRPERQHLRQKAGVRGCLCTKRGFYLNERLQYCVHFSDCPKPNPCGPNEHWSECATACPENCGIYWDSSSKPKQCNRLCESGCDCDEGYVYRRGNTGECIKPWRCLVPFF